MKKFLLIACIGFYLNSFSSEFSYSEQDKWKPVGGKMQSPINIVTHNTVSDKNYDNLIVNYKNNTKETIVNNGHTIDVKGKGVAVLNKRNFYLDSFHFHTPSEHTINGKHFPLEIHFVHNASNGRIAVIGVMAEIGKSNSEFQKILDNLKKGESEISLEMLLPKTKSYYHYLGSLTTPPLTENVEWYVLTTPITISKNQLDEFQKYYKKNNRHIQKLNERNVILHK